MKIIEQNLVYAESISQTVHEPLVILDESLRIVAASRSFCQKFQLISDEIRDLFIYELGNGEWNIPELRQLLEDIINKRGTINDFELRHHFGNIGEKVLLLNIRMVELKQSKPPLILLAIEDRIMDGNKGQQGLYAALQAKEELYMSEQRFRVLATAGFSVTYRMSPDWTEMWQLSGENFLSDSPEPRLDWLQGYIPVEEQPRVLEAIDRAVRTRSLFELEHLIIRVDGSIGWTHSRAVPLIDSKGEIHEWFGTARDITEQKKAERALLVANQKFQGLFNNKIFGLTFCKTVFDSNNQAVDYVVLDINPAYERLTGIKKEHIVNKKITEAAPGVSQDLIDRHNRVAITGEEDRFELYEHVTDRWYEVNVFSPETGYFVAVFANITERKLLEKRLADELDFTNAVIQTSGALITVIDLDGNIIRFNKACEELTGYNADEVIGRSVFDLFIPTEEREEVTGVAAKLFSGERWVDFENHWIIKSGERRFIRWRNSSLRDDNGIPYLAIATGTDITDRKMAEDALRESEERFRVTQELSPDGFLIFRPIRDNEGSIIDFLWIYENDAAARMNDTNPKEVIGRRVSEVLPNHDKSPFGKAYREVAEIGEVRVVEDAFYNQDTFQKLRWFRVVAVPTSGGDVAILVQDVTERKLSEEALQGRTRELEVANRDLESFSYSVSHDLRSPLTVIQGFCDILLKDYGSSLDEHGKVLLNHITDASNRMASIMADLLNFARISRESMNCLGIDLSPIANVVIDELRQCEPQRNVSINMASTIPAHADPRLMTIALRNLINNAWKYTSKNPAASINIGIMSIGNKNTYFIKDNGAGFDMNLAHKLFQPFERLHSESQFTGTGIGLAIVHRIIQRHGGKIWAESEIGRGSTFYFTLNCQ